MATVNVSDDAAGSGMRMVPLSRRNRVARSSTNTLSTQPHEIEHQRVGPGGSPNGEHGAPLDAVATVRQIHRQRVIQHVDPWTVRPWNGGGLLGREPTDGEQRDDHDSQRLHGGASGHPIAASASCISAAVWYRSTGSFAIARRITCASASGTS